MLRTVPLVLLALALAAAHVVNADCASRLQARGYTEADAWATCKCWDGDCSTGGGGR